MLMLTSRNINKVLARRLINFDISLTYVMFMPFQGQISVFLGVKPNQGLPITSALRTQTQSHTSSEMAK